VAIEFPRLQAAAWGVLFAFYPLVCRAILTFQPQAVYFCLILGLELLRIGNP
jgi:hypothetical protein